MLRMKFGLAVLALLAMVPVTASAAGEPPQAATALFETRHLDLMAKGTEAVYTVNREVTGAAAETQNGSNNLKLGVLSINDKGEREVKMSVFVDGTARDPRNFPDLTINPVFLWYLDRTVTNFRAVAGGDQHFLKQSIRKSFVEKAKVEPTEVDYQGSMVPAWRVTIAPFEDDPSAAKMRGFEGSKMSIVISEKVPGYFVDMGAVFVSKYKGHQRVEEHITFDKLGELR